MCRRRRHRQRRSRRRRRGRRRRGRWHCLPCSTCAALWLRAMTADANTNTCFLFIKLVVRLDDTFSTRTSLTRQERTWGLGRANEKKNIKLLFLFGIFRRTFRFKWQIKIENLTKATTRVQTQIALDAQQMSIEQASQSVYQRRMHAWVCLSSARTNWFRILFRLYVWYTDQCRPRHRIFLHLLLHLLLRRRCWFSIFAVYSVTAVFYLGFVDFCWRYHSNE